jgi:hypothetical protein
MRAQLVDRNTCLKVGVKTQVKSVQCVEAAILAKAIAAIQINYVMAITVQRSDGELRTQQVQVTGRKVEQRADSRVGLAVIVSQVALEVALQLSYTPVEETLPAI